MRNEPIDFDPAAREIAHEIAQLFRRIRRAVSARDTGIATETADSAA